MGLFSRLSPSRIVRVPDACIDCGKCTKACPSLLKVDQLIEVRSAECTGCYQCVAVCPAEGALDMRFAKRLLTPQMMAVGVAVLFLGFVGMGVLSGHWHTQIPDWMYFELVPKANQYSHP